MEEKLSLMWTHIHNDSLAEYLTAHSQEILASCKKMLHRGAKFGNHLSRNLVAPDMTSTYLKNEKELYHILETFFVMNPEYYCLNFELHIKDKYCPTTPKHSDRYTWMISDKYLVNQAWILLYNDSPNNYRNLDLFENPDCGLLNSNDTKVTTLDGYLDYKENQIFNGMDIKLGDILLFQNGIIHGTNPITDILDDVIDHHRMALAISFYKHSWTLTPNLKSFYYNFWLNDKSDIASSRNNLFQLKCHPFAVKIFGKEKFVPIQNPKKIQKIQDIEWFNSLQNELIKLKF